MHSLTTRLQDVFVQSEELTDCILEGLRKIPNWNSSPNNVALEHAACKLAASHLVRISLDTRRKAVADLLGVKRDVMDAPLTCISDFGDRWHTDCREPYFYEAGYTHDHLPECTYTRGVPSIEEPVHDLPTPIQVKIDGTCQLSDHKLVVAKADRKKKKIEKPKWACTARCRQVSDSEFKTIAHLHDMFGEDIQVLRDRLNALHTCPHVHTCIQEWEVPFNPEMPNYEHVVKERMGHPLACHLFGSECNNPLRILRNALVHYPALFKLQNQVYAAIRASKLIEQIDAGIKNHDHQLLLEACQLTFEKLFDHKCDEPQADQASNELDTPFRVKHLEALLVSRYASLIQEYDKKVRDYALNRCMCCDQLFRRAQCTVVAPDSLPDNIAWLTIKAYALMVDPDVWEQEPVYICNHCKPKVKIDIIPPRAVVNDLETVPLPDELKGLDPFSLQLIQLAKTFQTVIRLKTYSKRVPTYNALKACKGNMFTLPLPMANTASSERMRTA